MGYFLYCFLSVFLHVHGISGPVLSYFLSHRIHFESMLDMGPIITHLQRNWSHVLCNAQKDTPCGVLRPL